ncbi:MAG: DUF4358 domain-containing protein [Xylanivirga thermophila]|jgi:hypothetical protein|uniref:DUF4358 domain-containing protein n=1 Tax=Xylanivirga thermophila TaxID=2496273 RepID=UPI0039F5CFDB
MKKGYRIISIVFLLMFSITWISGCTKSDKVEKEPSMAEIWENIKKSSDVSEMIKGDQKDFDKLYDMDKDEVEEFLLYLAPSNIRSDEVAVIKANKKDDIDDIIDNIKDRIEDKKEGFKDYIPEEYELIQKHVLTSKGNYVLFVVSKDAEKIEEAFENSFK